MSDLTPVAWLHSILEPDKIDCVRVFSFSRDNPFSHWQEKHLAASVHIAEPLYDGATLDRLAGLIRVLIENDPNDFAADGVTVFDVWLKDATVLLGDQPK